MASGLSICNRQIRGLVAMRRTKEWWARLEPWERSWLVNMERASTYAGEYLPEDASLCPGCGDPVTGGMCARCNALYDDIMEKADPSISLRKDAR